MIAQTIEATHDQAGTGQDREPQSIQRRKRRHLPETWDNRFDVYFGVRASRDLYMVEDFRELSMLYASPSFVPVWSQQAQAGRRSDQVGAGAAEDFNDRDGWKAHLAGPPAMIDATAPLLIRRGVRAADIHAER